MRRTLQGTFVFLLCLLIVTGCTKKEFHDRYDRPANLAPAIYQQLEARGNFKNLLSLIDKAGYKEILRTAGYWTFFAPNDAAFPAYLQKKGFSSVDQIDTATAQGIVKYALVYNAFKTDRLPDFQSSTGWVPSMAFKRRTTYYEGIQTTTYNGQSISYVNSNRNNTGGTTYYVVADNNNKYIPYILDRYLTPKNLTAADYNYFYGANAYTGFNVVNAQVVNKDIVAENGVIHEVNQVIDPLPSIDSYLASKSDYSVFKSLFDKYMVTYVPNADATNKNKQNTGSSTQIYVKVYDSGLTYSPNNENYLKVDDNDGQMEGYTMFAPTNAALTDYINHVLLEFYPSLDALPKQIMYDFLNAHMFNATVWPSKFTAAVNSQGQGALFDPATEVVDKQLLSNGIFYGTSKVQNANVFSSVFGRAYLDPNYSLMTRALSASLKTNIINTNLKYTLFLTSDATFKALGFSYDLDAQTWRYTPPGGGTSLSGSSALDKLNRIVNMQVVRADFPNLGGSGIIETYNSEYIKFDNNQVYSAGNQEAGIKLNVSGKRATSNGTVYLIDGLLSEPSLSVGKSLEALAAQPNSPYKKFVDYVKNSNLYTAATGDILGITAGSLYTVFAPNNEAIDDAVAQGYLPADSTPSDQPSKDMIANFIRYHIIQKETIATDGLKEGGYTTLLQQDNGNPTIVTVTNHAPNSMQVTDMLHNTVNVINGSSNNLANRTLIHLVDSFLKFDVN